MKILGLSGGFHDAAAAVVVDGDVVAAVEQERLSRRKHDASFPRDAAATCLATAGLAASEIDLVVSHEKPLDVVSRHLSARLREGPMGLVPLLIDTPKVIGSQLGTDHRIRRLFRDLGGSVPPVYFVPHHVSHAAAAFYPSPFDEAAVLTVDGVGEWSTASIGHGQAHRIRLEQELHYPDSVGLLYSAFTSYCGMRVNAGEGELMGLAPFGTPRFADQILDQVVRLRPDGSCHLDQRYFAYNRGRRMTSNRFHRAFGGPPRPLGAEPGQREADLAASVQLVLERIVVAMAHQAHRLTGSPNLALAGGVALNCVANQRVLVDGPFDDVWVQPAAGDAGGAIGAALWAWHEHEGNLRGPRHGHDGMHGGFLGPGFTAEEVEAWAATLGRPYAIVADADARNAQVADRLAGGALVGWFTGRMEFGPRALGHRSILADPRTAGVRAKLNAAVKERAAFRPFAPAVLEASADTWFEAERPMPYMTFAPQVRPDRWTEASTSSTDFGDRLDDIGGDIPSVTHIDGSARVQTVGAATNPSFASLLAAFESRTGCPVLLNTSFNARDEPIVCSPSDALTTFDRIGLDLLVVEHCIVEAVR